MSSADAKQQQKAALVDKLKATKEQWDAEADASPDGPDETDALLSKAIEMVIDQGKGWASSEEREKYLETLLDGEFIPPLFAENEVELEKSGLKDAFTTLHNEGEFPGKNIWNSRRREIGRLLLARKMRQVTFSTIAILSRCCESLL